MPINGNSVTIQPGTYTVSPTYITNGGWAYTYTNISNTPNVTAKETSLNADRIIESLFRLNPGARDKYENDKSKFAAALIAAGDAAEGKRALSDLTDLGLTK